MLNIDVAGAFQNKLGNIAANVNYATNAFNAVTNVTQQAERLFSSQQDLSAIQYMQQNSPLSSLSGGGNPLESMFGGSAVSSSGYSSSKDVMGIGELVSAIGKSGLAKPNWFKVYITQPTRQEFSRDVSLFCESTSFPSNNISTATLRTYGPPIEYPYMKTYDPVSFTFLVDTAMKVKDFFDSWMNMVIDDAGTNDVGFSNEYCSDIEIYQLDSANAEVVHTIKLQNAYPKMIDPIQLSHRSQDVFQTMTVTMVYTKIIYTTTQVNPAVVQNGKNDISPIAAPTENNPFGMPNKDFLSPDFYGSSFDQINRATTGIRNQIMDTISPVMGGYSSVMNQARSFVGIANGGY